MPFVYRLQKVLEFRIRAKEQQLLVVQKAQQDVYLQEEKIRQNEAEIRQTIQNKRTADFRMMEYYDNYLHHLWDKADALEQERRRLQAILDEEQKKLVKLEQAVKVVEKHKEKQREAYLEEQKAIELCQKIQLKAKDISAPPSSLSGGNQQKVVFAKLLNCDLKVLILDEPTKGIDVGAKYSIYEIMNELTANGYAIIMVSSEMPEVLGMADRIVVMRSGRVVGQFDTQGTTQEMILEASLKHESDRREG